MKKIIILFLLFSVSAVFAKNVNRKAANEPSAPSALHKKFLEETKIELGEYLRTSDSPESCIEGPLELNEVGESAGSELSLMLGARVLAGSIGREKYSDVEDGCENTYETTFNEIAIKARTEQICSGFKRIYHTTINLSKGKLAIVNELYEGDKLIDTSKCTVVKKEASAASADFKKSEPAESKVKFKKSNNNKK